MQGSAASFRRSLAIIIGINSYSGGIPSLRSAASDAETLATMLRESHGYEVTLLLDEQASLAALRELFTSTLAQQVQADDRVLIYFAGHGIALDGDDGPAGFMVPADARFDNRDSFLPMQALHQALLALPCRHLLLILDCCFAGAFRWSSTRAVMPAPPPIYQERFDRFISDPAWQVLTSAADDQQAADLTTRFGSRGEGEHSPFATALFAALQGDADLLVRPRGSPPEGDGVITATELYCYLRDCVEANVQSQRQTPGLWALTRHDKGEFIFLSPGRDLNLPPAPPLSTENNPYRGLEPFNEEHKDLFFGRGTLVEALELLVKFQPLTVVTGSSGSGKSSLIKAGLLPQMRAAEEPRWHILPTIRPGAQPLTLLKDVLEEQSGAPLSERVAAWRQAHPGELLLLLVDQFEELVTLCRDDEARARFLLELAQALEAQGDQLRVIVTVRSDFEPQFAGSPLKGLWAKGRFVVPPMTQDDLREAIKGPAAARVLYFEPDDLVERIINEVVQMPGALPLLSFTLSELYMKYLERRAENRALSEADYEQLGGVAGALRNRANEEYELLDQQHQATMRRVMLRMVSLEGGGAARRRVPRSELEFSDAAENQRVAAVIGRLSAARLLIEGREEDGEAYVEPAHDALVRGWDLLWSWIRAEYDRLPLLRRLTAAARDWQKAGSPQGLLWDDDPRLAEIEEQSRGEPHWLNQLERSLVTRSSAYRRKSARLRFGAVAVSMIALAVLALFAFQQRGVAQENANLWRNEADQNATAQARAEQSAQQALAAEATAQAERAVAERQASLASSRELAAEAKNQLAAQFDLALLLGVEARRITETLESDEMLEAALEFAPPMTAFLHSELERPLALTADPASGWIMALDEGGLLQSWDTTTHQPAHKAEQLPIEQVRMAVFSPDSQLVALANGQEVRVWDRAARRTVATISAGVNVTALRFSPDAGHLATGGVDESISMWELSSGRLISRVAASTDSPAPMIDMVFNPDSSLLFAGSLDGLLWRWDLATDDFRAVSLEGQSMVVNALAMSPDGSQLALGDFDGSIRMIDPLALALLAPPQREHTDAVISLAFSPDGGTLASGHLRGGVIFWGLSRLADQLQMSMRDTVLSGHSSTVGQLAFTPDSQALVSASLDALILWRLVTSHPDRQFDIGQELFTVAFSPDGATLAGGGEGSLHRWRLVDGQPAAEPLIVEHGAVFALAYSPDGGQIAAGLEGGALMVWSAASGALLANKSGHHGNITSLTFSPDGSRLATAGDDGQIIFWDTSSWEAIEPFDLGHSQAVLSVDFSPDGLRLVSGGADSSVVVWDLETGDVLLRVANAHEDVVTGALFDEDGEMIVTSGNDASLLVRDIDTAEPVVLSGAHTQAIYGITSSADRSIYASAGDDQQIMVFFPEPYQALEILHMPEPGPVALNHDGSLVVAASAGRMLIWEIKRRELDELACRVANRKLTQDEWQDFFVSPYEPGC